VREVREVQRPFWLVAATSAVLVSVGIAAVSAQSAPPRPPAPVEPVAQILAAFRTHNVVTISDPHGNVQVQAFILSLIRDPRFREVVDDIVLETANSRYQDAIDRYVRGEAVPRTILRKAWEDHTVVNSFGAQAQELIEAVRALNRTTNGAGGLRVLAGDPPIDWENTTSNDRHDRWSEFRDSYPADLIRRRVIERERRALVVYGQGHLQRRQVASNYDMSTWQAQTIVSLLERDAGIRVFNIWTWLDREVELNELASWPVPSLAVLQGTTLGERDFGTYARGLLGGNRFAVQDGRLIPLPRDKWRMMRMEEQFDALLYLGPPSNMTFVGMPAALCRDQQFVRERLRRFALAGPPPELANFKKACGV
jgi:hypothetical protein